MPSFIRIQVLAIASAILASAGLLTGRLAADVPLSPGPVGTLSDLRYLNEHELRHLFHRTAPGPRPSGFLRGEVLMLDHTLLPRVKIGVTYAVWRGKHFADDCFINQWTGFCAIDSNVSCGPSYLDGKPALILEYPPHTPYFGKMRDEVRQVGPTVYLAMVFEKTSPPRYRGFIGLEVQSPKHR